MDTMVLVALIALIWAVAVAILVVSVYTAPTYDDEEEPKK